MSLYKAIRRAASALLLPALSFSLPAHANEQVSGTISSVFLSGAYNYAFRVTLRNNGTDALSGCTGGFAFMNTDDDNYQAKVASLLSAQAQHQTINVTISKDAAD